MSEEVDWRKFLAEEEDDSAATERIASFPRPESPWIYNMGCKEFIGYESFYSETLFPTSPLMSPHRHHQLPSPSSSSSPLWNNNIAADHYNIDTSFAKQIYVEKPDHYNIDTSFATQIYVEKRWKLKVVIRLSVGDRKKFWYKAMKIAASLSGVESVALREAEYDQIQVIGEGIDPVELTRLLRKNVGYSELLSVGPAEQKKEEEKKDATANKNEVTMMTPLVNLEAEEVTLITSWEIMDEQLHSSLPLTTEPIKSAPVELETLPDQIDMPIPILSELQIHGGTSAQNLTATTMVKKQKKRKLSSTTGGRSKISISLEDLQHHSHLSLEETARSLHVSKSTLKRRCRENGISEWSELKDLNVSEKSKEAGASNLDVDSIIVKVYEGDNIIRLELSSSSNKVDLEKEVATLLNLEVGSFRLKYEDEDGDRVLIARDFNWRECKRTSRSLGKTVIKLYVSQSI